jgi:hypothetical protein
MHVIPIVGGDGLGNRWQFNGDLECPTFARSVNWQQALIKRDGVRKSIICHYNLTMGMIAYCADSQHELAGEVVALPRIPECYMPVDDDIL